MSTTTDVYQIVDGVRRARAFYLAGYSTIRAVVLHPDGTTESEKDVSLDPLYSPLDTIDMSTRAQAGRFWRIWNAVKSGKGSQLPSILIERGNRGTLIKDVGWKT
jgi:hypothetical protein